MSTDNEKTDPSQEAARLGGVAGLILYACVLIDLVWPPPWPGWYEAIFDSIQLVTLLAIGISLIFQIGYNAAAKRNK